MSSTRVHRYEHGPTACIAHPSVIHSIQEEVQASRAVSAADVRLAEKMGLIQADIPRPFGMNDGAIYPPAVAAERGPADATPSRRASRPSARGRLHVLALLVDFDDQRGQRPPGDFQELLFNDANSNSLSAYYRDISYGALEVTGEVHGYLRAPHPYRYYTDGRSGMGETYPRNAPGLLVDALNKFCSQDDLSRFDADGDGFVDGIFLIHAGGGAEAEPDPQQRRHKVWSHKWVLPQPYENGSVRGYAFATGPEDGKLGVFAHEFGHLLGLPDLYDPTYRSRGVGNWCLMGAGCWGGGGEAPTRMCCWCLYELNWIEPQLLQNDTSLTIPPLANNSAACHRMWAHGKPGPEYFMIENRNKAGRDAALPASGLALWHIDESESDNSNRSSYRVALIQADGRQDLEFNLNAGDSGDVFPGTGDVSAVDDHSVPSIRAHDGRASGISLSRISLSETLVRVHIEMAQPQASAEQPAAKTDARNR